MIGWIRVKKYIVALGMIAVISVWIGNVKGDNGILVANDSLPRQENGSGEYEAELMLEIDGIEKTKFTITVPEQYLVKSEEERYLVLAVEEVERIFLKENRSLEEVCGTVDLRTSYQEGKVSAEWEFSNPQLITSDGIINEAFMQNEKEYVLATVTLTCGDSSLVHEFVFYVYKKERTEEDVFYEKLNELIAEQAGKEGTQFLYLPTEVEGHTLVWKDKESYLSLQIFLLGTIIVFLLPFLEKEREKEACEKRKAQLMREYPEMVNKLALLVGAGMTLQGAWKSITKTYGEENFKKQEGCRIVYEEMMITQREIESGKGEAKAYEAFGERCGLPKYRKLSNYLVQNLKKGNRGLCELLEKEAAEAFEERKCMVQQFGEEVGTKLLLPMLLMLGIVVVVIMIPAVISFQTGVS